MSDTPITDEHLNWLNLPDGRKVGIPDQTVDLLKDMERKLAAALSKLEAAERDAQKFKRIGMAWISPNSGAVWEFEADKDIGERLGLIYVPVYVATNADMKADQ